MKKMTSSESMNFFALMTNADILSLEGLMAVHNYDLITCRDNALGFNIYMHAAWGCSEETMDWVMRKLIEQHPDFNGRYGNKPNPRIKNLIEETTKSGMGAVEIAVCQNQSLNFITKIVNIGSPINLNNLRLYKFNKDISVEIRQWILTLEEREMLGQQVPLAQKPISSFPHTLSSKLNLKINLKEGSSNSLCALNNKSPKPSSPKPSKNNKTINKI